MKAFNFLIVLISLNSYADLIFEYDDAIGAINETVRGAESKRIEIKSERDSHLRASYLQNYREVNVEIAAYNSIGTSLKSFSLSSIDHESNFSFIRDVSINVKKIDNSGIDGININGQYRWVVQLVNGEVCSGYLKIDSSTESELLIYIGPSCMYSIRRNEKYY